MLKGVEKTMKKFWSFKNLTPGVAELLLYGEIQSERSWFDFGGGGIFADEFVRDLNSLGAVNQITCRINSGGGDIFAAVAIYTQLKMHAAKIICVIDGLAASAATLILMAGDVIQMPTGAMIMIHDPLAVLMGMYKSEELAKQADTLDTIKESIVAIYTERTGTSKAKLADMMAEETWMTADQAIELGFADQKISAQVETQMKGKVLYMNGIKHDLSGMKKIPTELEHAQKITDAIEGSNDGNTIIAQFVATAKKTKKVEPADPDDDGDESGDDDGDGDGKDKTKNKTKNKAKAKVKDDDEEIDDDDDEEDDNDDDDAKDKKAKKSVKNLMAKYPNTINYIVNQAKAEERQRIQEIDNISNHVNPTLLAKAKYTDCSNAKDLLYINAMESQKKGGAYLNAFAQNTNTSGVKDVGAAPNSFTDGSPEETRATMGDAIAKFANKMMGR